MGKTSQYRMTLQGIGPMKDQERLIRGQDIEGNPPRLIIAVNDTDLEMGGLHHYLHV
jgi:hypothetical protein